MKKRILVTFFSMFFVLAIITSAAAELIWTQKAGMTTARAYHAVGVVSNKIYVIGGAISDGTSINTVEEYNPLTNTWTARANMPTARQGLAVGVVNNKIYAIGGRKDGYTVYNTVEEYDPLTDTWVTKASMPTKRSYFGIGVVNNKIYAIGGETSSANTNVVEEYDPLTDSWLSKASMPTERNWFDVAVYNGKIYVIGGLSSGSSKDIVEEYNPTTNTWVTKASMPTKRYNLAVETLNNKIYAMGGQSSGIGNYFDAVEIFDPDANSWTTSTNLPTKWRQPVVSNANGKLCLFGGYDYAGLTNIVYEATIPPELSYASETNYAASCVYPEVGKTTTTYTFRAKYTSESNEAPGGSGPLLHIYKGGTELTGSPYVMQAADVTDSVYSDGKIYASTITLASAGTDYTYKISAYDVNGASATVITGTGPNVTADPALEITSNTHPQNSMEYANSSARFTFSLKLNVSGIVQGYYYLVNSSSHTLVDSSNGTYVTWNPITVSDLSDGIYYLHAVPKDAAGTFSAEHTAHYKFIVRLMIDPSVDRPFAFGDGTTVTIPAGAIASATQIQISTPSIAALPAIVNNADMKGSLKAVEIKLADGTTQLSKDITLSIPYTTADITGLNESNLKLFYFDTAKNAWVYIPGSSVDTTNKVVTANVNHLTIFRIVEYAPASALLEDLSNYPNPFQAGVGTTKIRYSLQSADNVRIRIFDLIGGLVWEQEVASVAGPNEVSWDGKNAAGHIVEIGGYICLVETGGKKLTTKIGVK